MADKSEMEWVEVYKDSRRWEEIKSAFSKVAEKRGVLPKRVFEHTIGLYGPFLLAMYYEESGKWNRIGITRSDNNEIVESWSYLNDWLRCFFDPDVMLLEVYPPKEEIVCTRNTRWFWVVPESDTQSLLKKVNLR